MNAIIHASHKMLLDHVLLSGRLFIRRMGKFRVPIWV